MSLLALSLTLLAALLHASWNAMLKAGSDRAVVLGSIAFMHALIGLVLVLTVPWPVAAAWPSIVISTFTHYAYYVLLFYAYRYGDLSQVYPISRGLAPAVVAIATYLIIGETLAPAGWAGLATVSLGIGFLAYQKGAVNAGRGPILLAVVLGFVIASYSVADGIGIRLSQSPLGYMGWLFLFEGTVTMVIVYYRLRSGGTFDRKTVQAGLVGGLFSVGAYGIVLYVSTFAPLGAVSAVRESSVVIATLIGVVVFGERPWGGRLVAAAIVAAGVIALASS